MYHKLSPSELLGRKVYVFPSQGNRKTSTIDYYQTKTEMNSEEKANLNQALISLAEGDFEQKWAAAKILVKFGDAVISPLKKVILDENAEVEHRCFGLRIFSQLRNPEIILVVTELLNKTEEDELISLATQTLAVQGKEAIFYLSGLLKKESYRLLACKALAQIPSKKVIESLLSVVEDENVEVRKTAIVALRNFSHPKIIQVMINALQDFNSQIRKEALIGLGLKLKANQEIPLISIIIPLLSDVDLSVAQQAAIALSRCRHPFAVWALEEVLVSNFTPEALKQTIIRVLGWIETTESIECLGKYILVSPEMLTVEIIKVLGRIDQPTELKSVILDILTQFYESELPSGRQPQVLQALCYTWSQLRAFEAIPFLQEIELSGNQQVIFHAQSAIKLLMDNRKQLID